MLLANLAADRSPMPLPPPPMPAASTHWAIFLDVDGTLLEFADDPLAVSVSPALLKMLHDLHSALGGAMALVSGRGLDDLDRLFGRPRWAAAGLHGLQLRHADGSFRRLCVTAKQREHMHSVARALVQRFDGVELEDKHEAIALHCRRAPEQFDALLEAATSSARELDGHELQPGNLVVEFKPLGMDKGRAVLELLNRSPFAGRTPIYLGDDLTDEHAFASINNRRGISVRIGSREPTLARFTLPGPASTEAWLVHVLETLSHGKTRHDQLQRGNQRQS